MKTITYRGEQYEVEEWVNFVAMDANCNIYAFENKPVIKFEFDEWMRESGRTRWIGYEGNEWSKSLEKV